MRVRVVTDSTADLPPQIAAQLGITVVPVYVRVGRRTYRDGVDITHDELYRRLATGRNIPTTSQPHPRDFAEVYRTLAEDADAIVSIHVASKLSGTYDAAREASQLAAIGCPIKVIDSGSVSMGLGLITMAAARLAAAGGNVQRVLTEIKEAIPNTHLFGLFDSLRYLFLGGRIGKAQALVGSVLNVKPLITLRDGELLPIAQVRTRARGVARLLNSVRNALNIQELAVIHSTNPDEADRLKERLTAYLAEERIHVARLGPALGVHGGPGTLAIALRETAGKTPDPTPPAFTEAGTSPPLPQR